MDPNDLDAFMRRTVAALSALASRIDDLEKVENAASLLDFDDAPDSYIGEAGRFLKVNSGETALEFTDSISELDVISLDEQSSTPSTSPSAGVEVRVYMKNDRLIFQFNDGGTIRYKYLLLSGTGVTWVHTTTAP